ELGNQRNPILTRQMRGEQSFGDERESHGESGGQARPGKGGRWPIQLVLPFATDCLVDNVRADRNALFNLGFLDFGGDRGSRVYRWRVAVFCIGRHRRVMFASVPRSLRAYGVPSIQIYL